VEKSQATTAIAELSKKQRQPQQQTTNNSNNQPAALAMTMTERSNSSGTMVQQAAKG